MGNKVTKIFGILLGAAIIAAGVELLSTDLISIGKTIKFGADFYTEIYDVTQDVGRAVNNVIRSMHKCAGWFMITLGAITFIHYLDKLVDVLKAEKSKAQAAMEETSNNNVNELPDL